jgi:hypothetical protein
MSETIDPLTTRYNALQSAITAAEAGMQTSRPAGIRRCVVRTSLISPSLASSRTW